MVDCCLYMPFRWDGQSSLLISLYSHCVFVFWKGLIAHHQLIVMSNLFSFLIVLKLKADDGIPRRFFTYRVIESQQHCQFRVYGHWILCISTRKVVERMAAAMDSWYYLYGWCSEGGSAVMVKAFIRLMRR